MTATQDRTGFPETYQVYKNYSRGGGGAIQFKIAIRELKEKPGEMLRCMFLECANQIGDKRFGWDNKIVVKLGLTDIGKLKSVLEGRDSEVTINWWPLDL